jgi:hypothetical protein
MKKIVIEQRFGFWSPRQGAELFFEVGRVEGESFDGWGGGERAVNI